MISRDCIITVNENKATIDSDIYLYKYDKNIQLAFAIINSKYMYDNDDSNNLIKSMQAAYAQVKFKKNDSTDIEIEFPIQATNKGAVLLTITGELIDEDTELGDYTIQIRLLDANKNSVVTLPPVESCIHILAPLFEKLGADTNEVNKAIVNKAVARYAAPLSATTGDGTFNSKNWVDGDKITTAELNRMETGIKTNSTNQINLVEDDTSMEGISDSVHDNLNTTDKTIIGAINEVNSQYKDIVDKVDKLVITGGGLSTTEKNLILTLFKNATYLVDMSNTVNTLETLFNGGSTDSDTYTIINNLTNVSTSNTVTSINKGSRYTAILTANKGYALGTITVTMGGIDVTSSVVSNNTIEISNVTGNIVITASNAQSSSESTNWTNEVPYKITLINNEYIDKTNGKIIQYDGWARTDYLGCYGVSKLKIVWGRASTYGAFYDTNKKFINNFDSCTNQDESVAATTVLDVPKNASYFIASNSTGAMSNCTITPYA